MKRTFFLTCLFLMACLGMQAQNLQVSGTVISKSDDLPVIGATVLEKGTTNGTITDFDGKFSLTVKQGAEIVVSYVGFKSQTLKANSVLILYWKKILKCWKRWLSLVIQLSVKPI